MKTIRFNEMTFYRLVWHFGSTNELLKFDGGLRNNSNATFKWIEYVR